MLYKPIKVNVPETIHDKLKVAVARGGASKKAISVKVKLDGEQQQRHTLLLTRAQIEKLERARMIGKKSATVRLSRKQVQVNIKHEGGFLGMLAALAARALPSLLGGLATGLVSGAVEKAITSSGKGLYLQKKGCTAKVQLVKGNGLYLTPHPHIVDTAVGNGLYFKDDHGVYNGEGLLLGPNSPFKNIPLLGLIL